MNPAVRDSTAGTRIAKATEAADQPVAGVGTAALPAELVADPPEQGGADRAVAGPVHRPGRGPRPGQDTAARPGQAAWTGCSASPGTPGRKNGWPAGRTPPALSWTDLPLKDRVPARGHQRDELCAGLILLVAGQVLRPGYRWLLRQRQALMLAEARAAIDPDGFRGLEVRARAAIGWARADAVNKLTWMVICKGGLVSDITVGDCIELAAALQEIHFRGSAGRPLFYALLKETGVLPASAPARFRALRVEGRRSIEQIVDKSGIECRPVRDLLVEYFTERAARARPHFAAPHRRHHLPAVLAGPGNPPPRHRLAAAGTRGRAGVEGTPGPHPGRRRASGPAPGELPQRAGVRPGLLSGHRPVGR